MDYLKPVSLKSGGLQRVSSDYSVFGAEVHLRDYLMVFRKRYWVVVALFLIVFVSTAVFTFTMRPVYRSTVTIQINKENPQIVDFKEVFSVNTSDTDYYQTQYKILESRSLARRVIEELNLSVHPEFSSGSGAFSGLGKRVFGFFSFKGKGFSGQEVREDGLVNQFLSRLSVEPVRNSRLVRIHFESHFPELSSKVCNHLARVYIQRNIEARFMATEEARKWLLSQLDDLKAKVERTDEELQSFGTRHGIISFEERENVALQRLNELGVALTKAESDRMAKEALYRQTVEGDFDTLVPILENKLIGDLRQSYIQLESQYMKLLETFKPDYPEVVRLKKQLEVLQGRIRAEVDRVVAGIRSDYESALQKERLLRKAFEEQKVRVMQMKEKEIRYNILKREADTNRELYQGLLQRAKEAGISAGIMTSNIQVVDQAEVPTRPYRPNKRMNLLLGALVGFFMGVGFAFFLEYMDNTVKTPVEVEQFFRLPSLGIVPMLSGGERKQVENGDSYLMELITHNHPRSMVSEAFRNIRTSILLSFSGKPPKRIGVTSPNPGEGKTTTAINTAIALSQTGVKVLLIDADLRRPKIHRVLGFDNGFGLSNFLSGQVGLEDIIRETWIPNLFFISSGPVPPNPSELIGSSLFRKMLDELGGRFGHIVLDSSPVLGFADSLVLSTELDGVILVSLSGKTPRETLGRARDVLSQVNARILGVVMNGVNILRTHYGYYYYRYYRYYAEEEKKQIPSAPSCGESGDV